MDAGKEPGQDLLRLGFRVARGSLKIVFRFLYPEPGEPAEIRIERGVPGDLEGSRDVERLTLNPKRILITGYILE